MAFMGASGKGLFMWKSGIFGVACATIIFGACSSNNGADQGTGASSGVGGNGQGGVSNSGGDGQSLGGNAYVGGAGQDLGGAGQNLGGAGYLGGAGNVGGGGSLGGTGGAITTGVVRTCAACDTTCCEADDCGVIGFAGCMGNLVDCGFGACAQSACGTGLNGAPGVANKCPGTCTPKVTMADCTAAGRNCDSIPDGCGGLFSCGTCTAPDTCGGGGTAFQCGSDANITCANFCPLVPPPGTCASGTDTVLHGTVWSPAGSPAVDPARGEVALPIPNAMIYVPNGSTTAPYGLSVFKDGVATGCDCTVQGPPLAIFPSGVDGSFTVTGVPAGVDVPLVIQLGKWRRVITIPAKPACSGKIELTAAQTRLPRRQAEQNAMDAIPFMALSTGSVDALECVFRKMGVEDTQFSNGEDSGNGRIRFYRQTNPSTSGSTSGGPGASCRTGGGSCIGTGNSPTPPLSTLVANQASVDRYDALLFPCKGGAHDESGAAKTLVLDNAANTNAYVNKGGRAIFTHYSYAWLYNQPPAIALPWPSTTSSNAVNTQWDTAYGQIDTSFPRGATFEAWLNLPNVNALTAVTPFPYITVTEVRRDLANPTTWPYYPAGNLLYAQRWVFHGPFMTPPDNNGTTTNRTPDSIQHVTFDTPYGDPATTQQCGRVLYSSFHVTSAGLSANTCIQGTGTSASTAGCFFPAECGTTMEDQEKVLAYMLFDMTATVCPTTKTCQPIDCASQAVTCGPASDGCGHTLDCGPCTGCTPITCEQSCANQGAACTTTTDPTKPASTYFMCPQPDGCGATKDCYCIIG